MNRRKNERAKIDRTAARVGLLAEGRVVDEALGTDRVTVGRHRADIADPTLAMSRHRLLRRRGQRWTLHAPPGAPVRLVRGGVVYDPQALQDRGLARVGRGGTQMELEHGDRVRLQLGRAVLLAQIVTAPLTPARRLPMELRAGPLAALTRVADLSPAMLLIVALVATTQIGAVVWLERFVPPPERSAELSAAIDRFRDIVPPAQAAVAPPIDVEATPAPAPDEVVAAAPATAPDPQPAPASPDDDVASDEGARDDVAAGSSDVAAADAPILEPSAATFAGTALASALRASDTGDGVFMPQAERSSNLRATDIISQQTARGSSTARAPELASATPGIPAPSRARIEQERTRLDVDEGVERNREVAIAPPPVTVRPGRVQQSGSNDDNEAAALSRDLDRNQRDLDRCYTRLTQAQGGSLAGRLVLQLEVAPDGVVTSARVSDNQLGGDMETCVTSSVRRWRFRRDGSGNTVTLRRAYVFAVEG